MAYTSVQSGEIPEGTQYYSGKLPLGDYNFYLKIDATGVSPKIVAQCESPDGTMRTAASRTWPSGTHVRGWSVEANETEASVYIQDDLGLHGSSSGHISAPDGDSSFGFEGGSGIMTFIPHNGATYYIGVYASATPGTTVYRIDSHGVRYPAQLSNSFIFDGKTVYYRAADGGPWTAGSASPSSSAELYGYPAEKIAWAMVYGDGSDGESKLIARFSINLGDAGGYPGGGGGWTQPGDWNPTPTTTLQMTVDGALSGRHNDPLHDTSYSYLPADNTAEAGYGCGGDGGHGGGGGGGASTVIVRQFATNKANNKNVVALAKRHGYGSGGGKGATGGDGCILIYY